MNRQSQYCLGCGKRDCEAPPLVDPKYAGGACGFDLSAFEDDCGNQEETRGRPARKYDYSELEYGESRFNPLGIIGQDEDESL